MLINAGEHEVETSLVSVDQTLQMLGEMGSRIIFVIIFATAENMQIPLQFSFCHGIPYSELAGISHGFEGRMNSNSFSNVRETPTFLPDLHLFQATLTETIVSERRSTIKS